MSARRILVTDAQDRGCLAAIRCLHDAGYRVGGTAPGRIAPGLWSRDCSERVIIPDPTGGVEAFVTALERALTSARYDVLIPCRDESLYAISHARERLAPHVELGLPGHPLVMRALSKSCLAEEAEAVGFPTPESRLCETIEDALEAADAFDFPVLLKGVSTIVHDGDRLTRHPTRLIADATELRDAFGGLGTCIVQRREPGAMMSFAGVATDEGIIASVVSRYRRTYPPIAGQACFLETIEPSGALTERVGALVQAIGWRGLFQLQMIESATGLPKPIDFNPRLFGSMSIAKAAGVPMTALWCAWLLSGRRSPAPVRGRPGVHYRMEDTDTRHILWLARNREFRAAALAAMPRRQTTHAYFRTRDPMPLLARVVQLAQVRWEHVRAGD